MTRKENSKKKKNGLREREESERFEDLDQRKETKKDQSTE